MQIITVNKDELKNTLIENRAKHRKIFEEAIEGYRKYAIQHLEARIEDLRKGKVVSVAVALPLPVDHTKDYDRVLKMVTMSREEGFALNERDFAQYVMDDWDWKRQFLTTNSAYSVLAATEAGKDSEE